MKCEKCGRPANVFIMQTINGKSRQIYLCENCARQSEDALFYQSRNVPKVKEAVCPKCKTRLSEFLKTGFLGCPDCYTAFGTQISEVLPNVQIKTKHVPRTHMGTINETREDKVKTLKLEMQKASDEMRYDDAEKIYKQLEEMGEL